MIRVDGTRQPALDNLLAIAEIARDLNDFRPLGETMTLICQRVAGMPACEWVTISLLSPDGSRTTAWGDSNIKPEFMDWARSQNPEQKSMYSPVFHAVASGRPVLISDISLRDDMRALAEGARIQGARALAYIPIMARGRVLGTLNCYDSQPHDHSDAQVDLLQTVARLVGIAAETALIADHQKQTAAELQQLTAELSERNQQLFEMSEAQYRLAECLVDPTGDGLHSLCTQLAQDLDASFVILDHDLGTRAFAGDEVHREPMTRALARHDRARLPEVEVFVLRDFTVQRIGHGRTLGYVMASRRLPEHGSDAVLLKHAASLVAVELEAQRADRTLRDFARPSVLQLLARGRLSPAQARDAAAVVGLVNRPARLALVRTESDIVASRLAASLNRMPPATGVVAAAAEGCTTMVLVEDRAAEGLGSMVRAAIGRESTAAWIGGSSGVVPEAGMMPEALIQAEAALAVAAPCRVTSFADLSPATDLLRSVPREQARAYVERQIGPLLEHDAARGSRLVDSVATYVRHQGSLRAAASDLSIHPNTLQLRLGKAARLLDCDFHDPLQLGLVAVAIEWHRVLG